MPAMPITSRRADCSGLCGQMTVPLNTVTASTKIPVMVDGRAEMRCSAGVKPNCEDLRVMQLPGATKLRASRIRAL